MGIEPYSTFNIPSINPSLYIHTLFCFSCFIEGIPLYFVTAFCRQWLEIQKLRGKVKRKVDTRASKGRKVRLVYIAPGENLVACYSVTHMY